MTDNPPQAEISPTATSLVAVGDIFLVTIPDGVAKHACVVTKLSDGVAYLCYGTSRKRTPKHHEVIRGVSDGLFFEGWIDHNTFFCSDNVAVLPVDLIASSHKIGQYPDLDHVGLKKITATAEIGYERLARLVEALDGQGNRCACLGGCGQHQGLRCEETYPKRELRTLKSWGHFGPAKKVFCYLCSK